MSNDIAMINDDAAQHYDGVWMQQGRVLIESDWNTSVAINQRSEQRSLINIIGPYGSPDDGFRIDNLSFDDGLINFDITPGTVYLSGLRLELESIEKYRLQKDWLQQPVGIDPVPAINDTEVYSFIYLEAWQQQVTAVEDSALYEVALAGSDTTSRSRIFRRVKIATGKCTCFESWLDLRTTWEAAKQGKVNTSHERTVDAKLKVTYSDDDDLEDLCTPEASGGYLGAENQAIRVQLVDENHFTWGYDNASPLYKILAKEISTNASGEQIQKFKFVTKPKDQYHWPLSNQVIEILPWSAVLANGEKTSELSGMLSKVEASYDPDSNEITIFGSLPAGFGADWQSRSDNDDLDNQEPAVYFYLRVWNRGSDLSSDEKILFAPGTPVALGNTGLEITFTGNEFVANDFWVIAARPETPKKVVPWGLEIDDGISPHGIRRYFAPLAVIKWTKSADLDGAIITKGEIVSDCRKKFNPLTEQDCCCTYTVGDGVKSKGDFNSIQEAINNLPPAGGKICILPGEHSANVIIDNKRQIRISGCGDHSIVGPLNEKLPVFVIKNSQKIQIDQLSVIAYRGVGVLVHDAPSDGKSIFLTSQITINENRIIAGVQAIRIDLDVQSKMEHDINILYNKIGMIDGVIDGQETHLNAGIGSTGNPAIFSRAKKVLIERNRIVVIPPPGKDPDDPTGPEDPGGGDPFDPCATPAQIFNRNFSTSYRIYLYTKFISVYTPSGKSTHMYVTMGGIQLGSDSERVRIKENEIIGGYGNGITLGDVPFLVNNDDPILKRRLASKDGSFSVLYEIIIEENRIFQMGLSGISSLLNDDGKEHIVFVSDLTVYRNFIRYCCRQPDLSFLKEHYKSAAYGGIIISLCEHSRFNENRIEENGRIDGLPVSGIFIFHAEEVDVSSNSIINNGLPVTANTELMKGNRGGVVIRMAFKPSSKLNAVFLKEIFYDGVPSAKIHDNVVVQPLGHALFLMAFGPVSVVSNQFTSMGTDRKNPLSFIASTIFIFNLGTSKDLMMLAGLKLMMRSTKEENEKAEKSNAGMARLLQYLPNGKTMYSCNQATLDMRSAERNLTISSQLIASLDDIAFNNNESECTGFLGRVNNIVSFDLVLLNTILLGVSVRANDNRFTEGTSLALYSLLSLGFLMSTAVGNQATHCMSVIGHKEAEAANIVLIDTLCRQRKPLAAFGQPIKTKG